MSKKYREYKHQKKKGKKNNDREITKQKTCEWATQPQLKSVGEFNCSWMASSSCGSSGSLLESGVVHSLQQWPSIHARKHGQKYMKEINKMYYCSKESLIFLTLSYLVILLPVVLTYVSV